MLVIDANVVVDLCLTQAGFDALPGHELVAPPLVRAEALSVLHAMHWRTAISQRVVVKPSAGEVGRTAATQRL